MTGYHQGLEDVTDVVQAVPPQSLGSGAATGAVVVDMQGWEGVMFTINVGAITGAGVLDARVVSDANSNMAAAANIANAALVQITNVTPNNVFVVDVWRPTQRYVQAIVTQAANTVIAGVTATLYRRQGLLPPTRTAKQYVKVLAN